jgi:protein-tyrosine phosphatase
MVAELLRHRLEQVDVAVDVLSAGFGPSGLPALDETVEAMLEVGIDLRQHRSHRVSLSDLTDSDIIATMTRQHAMDVVLLDPAAWPRTFPIVDLVRRGQ